MINTAERPLVYLNVKFSTPALVFPLKSLWLFRGKQKNSWLSIYKCEIDWSGVTLHPLKILRRCLTRKSKKINKQIYPHVALMQNIRAATGFISSSFPVEGCPLSHPAKVHTPHLCEDTLYFRSTFTIKAIVIPCGLLPTLTITLFELHGAHQPQCRTIKRSLTALEGTPMTQCRSINQKKAGTGKRCQMWWINDA